MKKKDIIAFWGYIEPDIIEKYRLLYPQAEFVDLDVNINAPRTAILPDASCKIIANMVDNAIFLKNEIILILCAIGKDKCDSGFFVSEILKDLGFNVETYKYERILNPFKLPKTPISTCNLPLREKITRITSNIIKKNDEPLMQCKAKFGFWGVPPNDLSILDLFPDNTHVFGWTRCVEANYPADIQLEMYVQPDLPTIFYTQTFCSKNNLAKYLADKYNGLHIDIDGFANNSQKAKIEAFLRLR